MPVILVVAPIAWKFAVSVMALGFATPPIIGTELLIKKTKEPKNRPLSDEEKASLERQNTVSRERLATATTIADSTLQSAAEATEEREMLMEQQHDAASLLLNATQEVTHAAALLTEVSTNSRERDASFNAGMTDQVNQLKDTVQHIPTSMALLSKELKEKQDMIESMNLRLTQLQIESSARESTLEKIIDQVSELTTQNQAQAETIENLKREKATLLKNVGELTEELELLTNLEIKQNMQPTNSSTLTFF